MREFKRYGKVGFHDVGFTEDGEAVLICRDERNATVRVNERALELFERMGGKLVVLRNCFNYEWEMAPEQIRSQPDYVPEGRFGAFWGVEPAGA